MAGGVSMPLLDNDMNSLPVDCVRHSLAVGERDAPDALEGILIEGVANIQGIVVESEGNPLQCVLRL